jgi:hypothetical protein
MIEMDKLYSAFIDTLNLILLPKKESDTSYQKNIHENLTELEEDAYTFLHQDNINKLYDSGYIPFEFVEIVENIRSRVINIDSTLWNANDFAAHNEWKIIREMVVDLFTKDLIK